MDTLKVDLPKGQPQTAAGLAAVFAKAETMYPGVEVKFVRVGFDGRIKHVVFQIPSA